MKIHEYQARKILSENGIPVPAAETVQQPEEAAVAFKKFAEPMCVVKAQVYAGGRGKAGFVKLTYQNAPGESTVSTDAGAIELKVPGGPSYAVKITKRLGVDNVTVPQDANSPRKINIHTNVGAVTVSPT